MGGLIIGIDLGTTYSVVAHMTPEGPEVIPIQQPDGLVPSAVALDDEGQVLVGHGARARAITHPHLAARRFKGLMGQGREISLGAHRCSAPMLSAWVLAYLKTEAEQALGRTIDEAIITVPAHFDHDQRQATRDAARLAGLTVERLINEPTAAALAYGLHRRGGPRQVAVLDLGGGTFDVSVLEIIDGIVEVRATAGDSQLGGEFFDEMLMRAWCAQAGSRGEALMSAAEHQSRLRAVCERGRHRLSEAQETTLRFEDIELTLTRRAAEALWAPCLRRISTIIDEAMQRAELRPEHVDDVILIGGASRTPAFVQLAAKRFGQIPGRQLPPDTAVALGAAIQGGLKSGHQAVRDLIVTDVAPFTLGISTAVAMGRHTVDGIFAPIIDRGTVIPASRMERFTTVRADQREIHIEIFQGERSLCRDNQKIGVCVIRNLPTGPPGALTIDVRFTCDLNGVLEVETCIDGDMAGEPLLIEQSPHRMSPEALAAAQETMQRLKFHPREALPNTTLIARAEAAHVELTGEPRRRLGVRIAHFRAALESQEDALIESTHRALVSLLDEQS
ncbi:MAG: Hsp70 family protein [Bradymonadia bacterium]